MQHQQPIYIVQQQTQALPIRLSNPTNYHLEQTRIRQEQDREYGAPPTPNNSFTNNQIEAARFVNNNNISSSSILPFNTVKQESNSPDYGNDVMSPMSNPSSFGSPHQNNGLDNDIRFDGDGMRSFNMGDGDADVLFAGDSPTTQTSMYSPGTDASDLFFGTSAPSVIGMNSDFKPISTSNRPHNDGFQNQTIPISASLPAWATNGYEATIASSFPQTVRPTTQQSVQFASEVQVFDPDYVSNTQEFTSNNDDGENFEKSQMVMEKKRRRRESHNAVERRRRDNINEKIQELSTLLPNQYAESANKPNKGMILRNSVNYIRDLKQKYNSAEARNQELEQMIRNLKGKLDVGDE